jgi:peptide/nickel transport system substrate-binding protein
MRRPDTFQLHYKDCELMNEDLIRKPSRRTVLQVAATSLLASSALPRPGAAQTRALTITTTGILNNANPYAHSSIHLYYIWSQVYGL